MLVSNLKTFSLSLFQSYKRPERSESPFSDHARQHPPTSQMNWLRSTDCPMEEMSDKSHCLLRLLPLIKVGVGSKSPRSRCQAGHLLQIPLLWGWVGERGLTSITLWGLESQDTLFTRDFNSQGSCLVAKAIKHGLLRQLFIS